MKNRLIYLVIFIFLAFSLSSCLKSRDEEESETEENLFSVKTEIVKKQDFDVYIKINGNVVANNTVSVYPEVNGKLVNTFVSLGSKIKKGDALVELNSSTSGEHYMNNIVRSPISGVITSVPLKTGVYVTTTTAVANVGDISFLRISCDVPEKYAGFLKKGIRANVMLVAHPDDVFFAKVESYSPVIDEVSRTKQVFLDFETIDGKDKIDEKIEAGMFAKLKLFIKNYSDVIVISESAVLNEEDENFVFVKGDDDTVEKRNVKIGEYIDSKLRIESGLNEGEKVVVEGAMMLSGGAKVIEVEGM